MNILSEISSTFWSPKVWLPPNIQWSDIAPGVRKDVNHADYRHLIYPLPMALVILVLRYYTEK